MADYYYNGESGDGYLGTTIHGDESCGHLQGADGGVRPVGGASVETHAEDVNFCGTCTDRDDDGDESDGEE